MPPDEWRPHSETQQSRPLPLGRASSAHLYGAHWVCSSLRSRTAAGLDRTESSCSTRVEVSMHRSSRPGSEVRSCSRRQERAGALGNKRPFTGGLRQGLTCWEVCRVVDVDCIGHQMQSASLISCEGDRRPCIPAVALLEELHGDALFPPPPHLSTKA